jgi:phosphate:Na+ symporter
MHANELVLLVLMVLGGLGLFMFAMILMTEALRLAAGPVLRSTLKRATHGRLQGVSLGTLLGFLVHSSATTVMLITFIHAGLMSLATAVPPIIGANIGTTLSMQIISFRFGDYWFLPVIPGMFAQFAGPRSQQAGRFLIGFGLLFLGMNVMSGAIAPHRESLAPWLAHVHGSTLRGMLTGVAVATLLTSIIQSSGATIGMCFALIQGGAITSLEQVYPIVLGAHIGTCATGLLASIGASMPAKRAALAHLFFNILGTAIAIAASPLFVRWIPLTSDDLLRQTANLHTLVMLLAAVTVLPFSGSFARLVTILTPSRKPEPEASFLDEKLLETPEQAIYAGIRELQRVARLSARSFRLNGEIIFQMDRAKVGVIRRNEETIDEIQRSMRDYLASMTRRYLSRRQALLIQHLNRCMTDIERIEDHNDNLRHISKARHHDPRVRFPRETLQSLFELHQSAEKVLQMVIQSLNPDNKEFQTLAKAILQARDEYVEKSISCKEQFGEKIAAHDWPPILGIYLSDYMSEFDRIVRHSKNIALVESQPYFWIKRRKLNLLAPEAPEMPLPPAEESQDFLDKLQSEGFV